MGQDLVKFTMEPRTLEEAMKFADIIAKSDLIPKNFQGKPGDILVAIQWGQEVGLKPLQALQNIAVVNGRPSLYGDAPLALVKDSGKLEDFREDFNEQLLIATCTAKRRGQPTPITYSFSKSDAEKAGLWSKQNYQQYPKRMLKMRARAFVLRDGFPDVLKGMAIGEEQEDIQIIEAQATPLPEPPAPPKRMSQNGNTTSAPDEVQGWLDLLSKCESIENLASEWNRLCPASKDGFYHKQPQDVQAQLQAAKNTRKQHIESAVSSVEFPTD